jgi:hypothetical protein
MLGRMRAVHSTSPADGHIGTHGALASVQPRGPRARGIDGREELMPKVLLSLECP